MSIQKVIIATDGSENSLRAARYAGPLLAVRPEAEVIVVYVAGVPPEFQGGDGFENAPLEIPLDDVIRRNAGPILARTEEALELPRGRVQSEVLVGRPDEEIVTLAKAIDCDLIICGRRGLSGIRELLLGSISNRLVHTAPCPVLVVQ